MKFLHIFFSQIFKIFRYFFSNIFVLHSSRCRSRTFFMFLYNWFSRPHFKCFFFLQIFEVFRIFFHFFVNFFYLHFPGVAVTDVARWNSLFNWFVRFILLFLFKGLFLFLKCLEFFYQLFRWFFQLQLLTSRY